LWWSVSSSAFLRKTLRTTLLVSLVLVLFRLLWILAQGSMTVVWLCLFMAIIISARLMFFVHRNFDRKAELF